MKKKVNKETKAYKLKELRRLKRKCLALWSQVVKIRAGWVCEAPGCLETRHLNSHHIESYLTNFNLRYDLQNGICVCPGHHRFKKESAHRSPSFVVGLLLQKRKEDLKYLLANWNKPNEKITKEFLLQKIEEFTTTIADAEGG